MEWFNVPKWLCICRGICPSTKLIVLCSIMSINSNLIVFNSPVGIPLCVSMSHISGPLFHMPVLNGPLNVRSWQSQTINHAFSVGQHLDVWYVLDCLVAAPITEIDAVEQEEEKES